MNPILNSIDFIARSPGGVALMRKLVLELAVRGKLVPQDPRDEPASVLLERIKREKARLVKEGKIKAGKELPEIKEEEKPYELPKGWEWVRLGQIIELISGQHLLPSEYYQKEKGFPYYTGPVDFGIRNPTPSRWTSTDRAVATKNDILLTVKGAGVGKINILGDPVAAISRQLMAIRPIICTTEYLYLILSSKLSSLKSLSIGIAIPGISREDVCELATSLPPLSEQSRIVARVQELMAILDRLEDQTNKTEEERNRALIAVTQAVSQAATPEEIASSWLRLATDIDRLVDRAEDVKTIRAMVLELAVRGKLVSQDPRDEPASVLLERIQREKARLVKEGKIKAGKELPEIKEEEKPYELPRGWAWARLGNLSPYGVFDGDWIESKDQDKNGKIKLIQLADIQENLYHEKSNRYVNEETFYRLQCSEVVQNDILIARLPNPIGRACVFPGSKNKCITAVDIAILRSCSHIDNKLISLFINSPTAKDQIIDFGKGATRFRVSTGDLKTVLLPLPPLAEQSRIVTRVQELMAVLDRLEEKLAARDKAAVLASESTIKMNQA